MKYNDLIRGKMVKRYKRFLADIALEDGHIITVHCPNSGSMRSCWEEGWDVLISDSKNPKRKLQYTLELIHNGTCWICVNTQVPNKIAFEAIEGNVIKGLDHFEELKREVKYGEKSRIDILGKKNGQECYIEIKSVTLLEDGQYQFPDGVSTRGQKHLEELSRCVDEGHRAVMLFVINRSDGTGFTAARKIDPKYADLLEKAADNGVEIIACQSVITAEEIYLSDERIEWLRT